ncbi:hypothetical protein V6N11_072854 [Hibiscus sabdariffa]|uniref:Uncharacterized protein n=2 Tax=Hibiscus sabdariffa TaxID=183260 RepID=A0ABR1ZIZ5_9ROSI
MNTTPNIIVSLFPDHAFATVASLVCASSAPSGSLEGYILHPCRNILVLQNQNQESEQHFSSLKTTCLNC